ncbi:RNA-binding protein [Desulfotomaculum nigrificans CO-1-SRB]|uniref:RNA-binding protein n=1 Tax=Desulfotomaculum nigrificans (strain DSM 14880 / VKM B-2319 / CO-1-SRB) TaxID=868595 RepID=F6B4Z1_DESCC|nr:CooT family nickel-binding protein [Desulfotomaculum nigrificans]AEF95363.1 RNA-binding protein [Desulfotomaculum nigrificans CO-1-SRB]
MCEANAYFKVGDQEELLLENVDKVIPQENWLLLEDIFGHRKLVRARIKELSLVDHKIYLEKLEQ